MKLKPLYDRVIIKRSKNTNDTIGGIIVPDIAKEQPSEGVVLAVGEGKYVDGVMRPLTVKVGDTVLFGKYAGSETTIDGEKLIIMREDEILGVLED